MQNNGVIVKDVRKSFDSNKVLESVSFDADGGKCFCIFGPNSAGKSTLLKLVSGLLRADGGNIEVCGVDIGKNKDEVKNKIAILWHKSLLYQQLTVHENLCIFANMYGVCVKAIDELMEQTNLTNHKNSRAGILSQGLLQKLAIARAFVQKPSVLLADEPFASLDIEAAADVQRLFVNLKHKGGTIIMTSHDIRHALEISDRVGILYGGKLVFNESIEKIAKDEFAKDYLSYAGVRN